jgi:cathepsin K
MKISKFYYLFLILFLLTCNNEPVDTSVLVEEVIEEEQEEEQDENTFVDKDGNVFYTGVTCEQGSPNYGVGDNVLVDLEIPDDLPTEFDLSEFLPPVGSQGSLGSCTSWAISYYMKSMQERIQSSGSQVLSPAYTYNQLSQGVCGGTALKETLDILKEQGVSSWSSFPYSDTDCTTQPSDEIIQAATENKISDYKGLSGDNMVNEIKTLLTQQTSIIISTTISKEFGRTDINGLAAYREHAVNYSETGCHALLVVGYSDFNNAFKVVNSWGTDWGDSGFVWIDYKAFENVSDNAATFRVINAAYIAYDAL